MAVSFSMRMDEELKTRLEREAAHEERSASYIAQKAIEQFLDAKAYKRDVISAAYEQSLTQKEFISGEKMTAWVESWGTENELPEPTPDVFK